jgi:hypothetical protein
MTDESAPYSARTPEDYLRTRVDFKTEAYRQKCARYRFGYLTMACLSAIAAAAVPVLINLDVDKIYPTLLSLLVTVIVGLEGILHFREHWKNYDLMKSFLRQEACLFEAGAGSYKGKTPDEAFVLLVERVEEEIAKERAQTINMRTSRSAESGTGGKPVTEGAPKPEKQLPQKRE